MSTQEMLEYRLGLFDDVIHQRKPERVPMVFTNGLWPIQDAGLKISETLRDYDALEGVFRRFLDTYPVDTMLPLGSVFCAAPDALDSIGKGHYVFDDEKNLVSLEDVELMEADDYPILIADYQKYIWEVVFPKKFPNWHEKTRADFMQSAAALGRYYEYMGKVSAMLPAEYGIPNTSAYMGLVGIEDLYSNLRGIKGVSMDLRKQPEMLLKACEVTNTIPAVIAQARQNGIPADVPFGFYTVMLAHNFLNPRQFDMFYWPQLKELLDCAADMGTSVCIFAEGSIARFYDKFKDYPVGTVALHLEQDNVYEAREALPNCTIVGGLKTEMLGKESPETCVAYAKKLCDDLGRNGGFILAENRMMSYAIDGTSENIKAVNDFATNYKF